jgi:D-beta-D-heptose 7-phosphate kinase/D-beta-D-heptose 1-phosphate adenosyltransferase
VSVEQALLKIKKKEMKTKKIVIVSGYFNPVHVGHISLLERAKELGDELQVIVNNDKQVKLKGSVPFMSESDRCRIIHSMRFVDCASISCDEDKSVCDSLRILHLLYGKDYEMIFANGGDRKNAKDIPEAKLCKELGIKMVFNVGGKKIQSSSKLISKAKKYAK